MGKSALPDIYHFDTLGRRDLPVYIWHINLWSGDYIPDHKAFDAKAVQGIEVP